MTTKVHIKNSSKFPSPEYATALSAGVDLRANIETPMEIPPLGRALVPTGLSLELPAGFEAQIRPRSGLAFKHGITVLNSPGTIDADYRGEVKVLLINHSTVDYHINPGERIAQMVIARHEHVEFIAVEELLTDTERGAGGFGSTGK